jgi:hypothetical protein
MSPPAVTALGPDAHPCRNPSRQLTLQEARQGWRDKTRLAKRIGLNAPMPDFRASGMPFASIQGKACRSDGRNCVDGRISEQPDRGPLDADTGLGRDGGRRGQMGIGSVRPTPARPRDRPGGASFPHVLGASLPRRAPPVRTSDMIASAYRPFRRMRSIPSLPGQGHFRGVVGREQLPDLAILRLVGDPAAALGANRLIRPESAFGAIDDAGGARGLSG